MINGIVQRQCNDGRINEVFLGGGNTLIFLSKNEEEENKNDDNEIDLKENEEIKKEKKKFLEMKEEQNRKILAEKEKIKKEKEKLLELKEEIYENFKVEKKRNEEMLNEEKEIEQDINFGATLLRDWKLSKYKNILIDSMGYEDVADWADLTMQELQEMGFKPGHAKKFRRKVKEYMMQKMPEEQLYDDEGADTPYIAH